MKKGLLFDLDGTLWDSSRQVAESWDLALKELGLPPLKDRDTFKKVAGLPMDKIAERLFPDLEGEEREKKYRACASKENSYLSTHPGVLYPHVKETLEELSKEYELFIVSNCQKGYIEAFLEGTKLQVFKDYACWGDNHAPKSVNILNVIKRNHLDWYLYIGDTVMDQEAAKEANVRFIYASYGFGKVVGEVITLKEFRDLPNLLKSL